jgi:drug/metabolite transporter (DMT)-like permease
MFAALLAAVLFACSAVVSQRSTRIFGAIPANFYRLCIACAVLGLVSLLRDLADGTSSIHPDILPIFLWSGLVGFGIGDIALFLAYARLGSRLTILINWCSAALFAAGGDYLLRGRFLGLPQWIAVIAILAGLVVALRPAKAAKQAARSVSGVLFAVLAGISMGMGTVMSGRAIDAAVRLGIDVSGVSQAFQRSSAGVLAALVAFLIARRLGGSQPVAPARPWKHKPFWLISTALCGPVIGVSCYQWAQSVTGSSTIVVAIASTSSLLVIPLARAMEKDTPGVRELAGTLLAAAGVVALKLFN